MYKKKKNKKNKKHASYCQVSPSEIIYSSAISSKNSAKAERKMLKKIMRVQKEVEKVSSNLTLATNEVCFV